MQITFRANPVNSNIKNPAFCGGKTDVLVRSGKALGNTRAGIAVVDTIVSGVKKGAVYTAGTVTGAVVLANKVGDDIKPRLHVRVRPVKILKDLTGRLGTSGANESTSVVDVLSQAEKGISSATGVDIKKSSLHVLYEKAVNLFKRSTVN